MPLSQDENISGIWNPATLRKAQQQDRDIKPVLDWMGVRKERPGWEEVSSSSPTTKAYWAQWDSLKLRNGVLYRNWESPNGLQIVEQLVVPRSYVENVLQDLHNSQTGGHFGVNKTLARIRERFYWLKSRTDVQDWCRECTECRAKKGPTVKSKGKLQLYNVGAPFERIAVDIAGPFPRTRDGNKYLLVVIDYFTKWPEVYPVASQDAETIAECIVTEFVSRYGVPQELHSDQGRNFEAKIFQEMCVLLEIKKTRTTPLHPQSDGMVERFNRTIEEHLTLYITEHQRDWDRHLPLLLMAYRTAVHDTTGFTPAMMLFGRELRLPIDIVLERAEDLGENSSEYVKQLQGRLEDVHVFARENIQTASQRMKTRYDVRATKPLFAPKQKVWLYNPRRRKGLSPKLQKPWEGPYEVITRINDVVYRIQHHPSKKYKVVHIDRLAAYGKTEAVRDEQNLTRGVVLRASHDNNGHQ